ncbi:hypothetical protein KC19_10G075100 [Ceratodon purpureus]|uniref:Methyltransferase n=1 Tax=Ceratodon purpureus TaxID=3225 RepID=A0A8T0GJ65_CERPU|nr:hypothetical protein KC19_10G075100 [Ceratodon purpureus]
MAMAKSSRPGERGSSPTLIIAGSVLVGFFLIAVWVFTAPAAIPEQQIGEGGAVTTNDPPESVVNHSPAESVPDTSETVDDMPNDSPAEAETEDSKVPAVLETQPTGDGGLPDSISTQAELTTENREANTTDFETQAAESKEEKESLTTGVGTVAENDTTTNHASQEGSARVWKVCKFEGAQDFIPCLDNEAAIKKLRSRKHYEHRERHCPSEEELPKCLLPLPTNFKAPITWPTSRDQIWFSNVPHTQLVSYKADQNWVKVSENQQKLIFPGGGTQFKQGARHYIDFLEEAVPDIAWGKHTRVILDVGCGVASFGGYLFDKDVLAMSIAPKDEHEAQVQMALERGIPAVSAVMGTQRLVFPSNVFDAVHCARCRVPWHLDGGKLLLELNRVLRPGGFFLWSATPVYWKDEESIQIWRDTKAMVETMSWKLVAKKNDPTTKIGVAVFQKPKDNDLYNLRQPDATPPFCEPDDKADAAWYVPMNSCIHKLPTTDGARATSWPADWPLRVESTPSWLSTADKGIYGKPVTEDFRSDTEHWKRIIEKSYLQGLGIQWGSIRNVMDMKAGYGGFAAALVAQPVWVMNIVPVTEPDTLPIIYDRGFIGMYHDWCEPHSTYPRSYDLMHADHLISTLTKKCNIVNVVMEMDRILRPDGWAIFRDKVEVLKELEDIVKSLHWDIVLAYTQGEEELLVAQKRFWRPSEEASGK